MNGTTPEIQRFTAQAVFDQMVEASMREGAFVLYEHHLAIVSAKDAEIARLRARLDARREDFGEF